MLEAWLVGNNWTQEQWLVFSIIAFVIVASLVIAYRLYTIFKMSTKKRERPNFRAARRLRR
jgi:membrane protein DedA with SNARE-associated domain